MTSPLPPSVLDPTCGGRAFYFDKRDPRVLFTDIRKETLTVCDRTRGVEDGTRTIHIEPEREVDFRAMPFEDGSFDLVVFDPPHLVRAGRRSWLAAKYGKLGDDWQLDLARGFDECFRVLRHRGTLIFKWSEVQVPLELVLRLAGQKPLFGNKSPRRAGTHWIVFIKCRKGGAAC